jgi:hypothetical protein
MTDTIAATPKTRAKPKPLEFIPFVEADYIVPVKKDLRRAKWDGLAERVKAGEVGFVPGRTKKDITDAMASRHIVIAEPVAMVHKTKGKGFKIQLAPASAVPPAPAAPETPAPAEAAPVEAPPAGSVLDLAARV